MLVDDTRHQVLCCIWGRPELKLIESKTDPMVLAIRNAKLSTYCGFSINVNEDASIETNPSSDRSRQLKNWFATKGRYAKMKCLSDISEQLLNLFGFNKHLKMDYSPP